MTMTAVEWSDEIESELWVIFIATNCKHNPKDPEVMRKRDFVTLMRGCKVISTKKFHPRGTPLMDADVNVIHQQEMGRNAERKFNFSAFKRAMRTVATRVYQQLSLTTAMSMLESVNLQPHTVQLRCGFEAARSLGAFTEDAEGAVAFLADFACALRKIFAYFGTCPTELERRLGRHPPRDDISQLKQSLPLPCFLNFSSCFNLHPGIADQRHQTERTLTHSDLATIFFASTAMERVDSVGGLSFEEFNEALVRAALAFTALRGGTASSPLQVASSSPRFQSAEDKLFALFQHMAHVLPRTVPRFVNESHSGVHDPGRRARGDAKIWLGLGGRGSHMRSKELLMKGSKLFMNAVVDKQTKRQQLIDQVETERENQRDANLKAAVKRAQAQRVPTLALAANAARYSTRQSSQVRQSPTSMSQRGSTIAGGSILFDFHTAQEEENWGLGEPSEGEGSDVEGRPAISGGIRGPALPSAYGGSPKHGAMSEPTPEKRPATPSGRDSGGGDGGGGGSATAEEPERANSAAALGPIDVTNWHEQRVQRYLDQYYQNQSSAPPRRGLRSPVQHGGENQVQSQQRRLDDGEFDRGITRSVSELERLALAGWETHGASSNDDGGGYGLNSSRAILRGLELANEDNAGSPVVPRPLPSPLLGGGVLGAGDRYGMDPQRLMAALATGGGGSKNYAAAGAGLGPKKGGFAKNEKSAP